MPMLADIEDPPSPRGKTFIWAFVALLPVGWAIWVFIVPAILNTVRDESANLDARHRAEDNYMHRVCSEAMVLPRDETLCSCALGAEYPSLDCRIQFTDWTMEIMVQQCKDDALRQKGLAFCSCLDVIAGKAQAAKKEFMSSPPPAVETTVEQVETRKPRPLDDQNVRLAVQNYERCIGLDDALFLPSIEKLIEARDGTGEAGSN